MAEGQEQTELVRRARSRDQAAITRLYGLYGGTVFGIAQRMLGLEVWPGEQAARNIAGMSITIA